MKTLLISSRRASVILGGALLASCGSTFLAKSWHDQSFAGPPLRSVLVCAQSPNAATQRMLEDAFVRELQAHGVTGVECHAVLPPGQTSTEQVDSAVARAGADGVILMTPDVREFPVWEWGPGEDGPPYLDGTPETDAKHDDINTEVEIQTRAYFTQPATPPAAQQRELVWSGISRTLEPTSVRTVVSEAIPKFVRSMTKAGVLPPRSAS